MSLLGALIVAELHSIMSNSVHFAHLHSQLEGEAMEARLRKSAMRSNLHEHTFTQAGRFFRTYFKPSSSRSVRSLTVFANRALLQAFTPA